MSFPDVPNFDPGNYYIPDPPGVYEHNLGDLWRGVWQPANQLPDAMPALATFGPCSSAGSKCWSKRCAKHVTP